MVYIFSKKYLILIRELYDKGYNEEKVAKELNLKTSTVKQYFQYLRRTFMSSLEKDNKKMEKFKEEYENEIRCYECKNWFNKDEMIKCHGNIVICPGCEHKNMIELENNPAR